MEDKRAIRFERSSYLPEQVARIITNLIILTFQYSSYSPPNLSLGIKVNPFKRNIAYSEVIQMKSLKNEQALFRPVYRIQYFSPAHFAQWLLIRVSGLRGKLRSLVSNMS